MIPLHPSFSRLSCRLARLPWLLAFVLWSAGCSTSGQVSFTVKGAAPTAEGSFINRRSFRIAPSKIQISLGDIRFLHEEPSVDRQVFDSLEPLLRPNEVADATKIGVGGRFPGLAVVNLLPQAPETILTQGRTEAGSWKQIQIRLAPATLGVRGVNSQDEIFQRTFFMDADLQKNDLRCKLLVQVNFEFGLAVRIDQTILPDRQHNNRILLDYSKWFDDIDFETPCLSAANRVILINETQNASLFNQIRAAMGPSFSFSFQTPQ